MSASQMLAWYQSSVLSIYAELDFFAKFLLAIHALVVIIIICNSLLKGQWWISTGVYIGLAVVITILVIFFSFMVELSLQSCLKCGDPPLIPGTLTAVAASWLFMPFMLALLSLTGIVQMKRSVVRQLAR